MCRKYLLLVLAGGLIFTLGVLFACQSDDDDNNDNNDNADDDNVDDDNADDDSGIIDDDNIDDDGDDDSDDDIVPDDDDTDDDDDDISMAENVTDSGCVSKSKTIHDDYTYDDELKLDWDGQGLLSVYHGHTCYNCGFQLAQVEYQTEDGVLSVWETSQENYEPYDCMCLFEFTYDLVYLSPGDYTLEIYLVYRPEDAAPEQYLKWQETISLPAGEPDHIEFSEYHPEGCG